MQRFFLLCLCLTMAAAIGPPAWADEPPPFAPDPISIDRASPSVIGFGNTPGDIYGESAGFVPGGWDFGGPGPILHVKDITYGLAPFADNNDGHSNGELDPTIQHVLYFSGDDLSVGLPGTHYDHQAIRSQAAGDRFVTNGATAASPAAVMATGVTTTIAGPVLPGPINLLSANQTRYNEIPSIPPAAFNAFLPPPGATVMDDMDALEITPIDVTGDLIHDSAIYFSVDPISPVWAGPADVLVAPPGLPGPLLFAPAFTMGLAPVDNVDALAVWDVAGDLLASPAPLTDFALFSLAPGSPFLAGADTIFGTADDFSAADIFVTDFSGGNVLFLTAGSIGMAFTDNVDAIDVEGWAGPGSIEIWDEIPEPASVMVMGIGALALLRRRG